MSKRKLNIYEQKVLDELCNTIYNGSPLIELIQKNLTKDDLTNEQVAKNLYGLHVQGKIKISESALHEQNDYVLFCVAYIQDLHEKVDERKKLGNRIKQLREEADMTQEELAEKTGILQQNLIRIEKGKYSTGQDILSKIAQALGKKLDIV